MPTSVLLAVLAAAGLLALAPALVRRYDAIERLEAERARSAARVLPRRRRRLTTPGRWPVNPPRRPLPTVRTATPVYRTGRRDRRGGADRRSARPLAVVPRSAPPASAPHSAPPVPPPRSSPPVPAPRSSPPVSGSLYGSPVGNGRTARRRPTHAKAVYRRRRVLVALLLLNLIELVGVATVDPGFWAGFAVTATLLVVFLGYLRHLALTDRRRRRVEARRQAWLAAQQQEVRREQERRAAERRAAARRLAEQRESLRRTSDDWSADPTVSYRRASGADG